MAGDVHYNPWPHCNCCSCQHPQTTWGGFEDKRIADSLEKIEKLLEQLLEKELSNGGEYK